MPKHSTAILFFSRTASVEAVKKHWLPKSRQGLTGKQQASGQQRNGAVAHLLIQHTKQSLKQAPFPVFHFTELEQQGNSFGERFANAFQRLFDIGFDAVISVGNDSPHLQKVDWERVGEALGQKKAVIGPNLRGGSYLIALHKDDFDRSSFENLPWQTSQLASALDGYLADRSVQSHRLEAFQDLNTLADLLWLLQTNHYPWLQSFCLVLRALLSGLTTPANFSPKNPSLSAYTLSHSLRGPPLG